MHIEACALICQMGISKQQNQDLRQSKPARVPAESFEHRGAHIVPLWEWTVPHAASHHPYDIVPEA